MSVTVDQLHQIRRIEGYVYRLPVALEGELRVCEVCLDGQLSWSAADLDGDRQAQCPHCANVHVIRPLYLDSALTSVMAVNAEPGMVVRIRPALCVLTSSSPLSAHWDEEWPLGTVVIRGWDIDSGHRCGTLVDGGDFLPVVGQVSPSGE